MNSNSIKRKRGMVVSYNDNMRRAREVQVNLAPEIPSFLKIMLRSHVSGGFWLGLPKQFCCQHMPKNDATIILEDENGEVYETKYLAEKVGLSGGWRGFSVAHKLLEEDVLVFQLVKPSKFKAYILRTNHEDEVDGALGLLKLEEAIRTNMTSHREEKQITVKMEEYEDPVSLLLDNLAENIRNDSEYFGSGVLDGIRLSKSPINFNQVKSLHNFSIIVNGLVIDSEFSQHLLKKYYELCCSQKSFLHNDILEGLNIKLVSGIISETINTADAIRASKITTSHHYFSTWDKTLVAFEVLGMNVGFLRARLDQLVDLALRSKRYIEAKRERDYADEEVGMLNLKLLEAKARLSKLEGVIQNSENSTEKFEMMFKEVANAPWG